MSEKSRSSGGRCTCGQAQYRVTGEPMIVHCCHCQGCQKNSGSAFAINALFEANRVELVSGETESIEVPTPSGAGQIITRCSNCRVALWSNYHMGGLRERIRFVRVGTLDHPDQLPPDIHIFTESKQSWVTLPETARRSERFYDYKEIWSPDSLTRRAELKSQSTNF